jgi:hypothetical protein
MQVGGWGCLGWEGNLRGRSEDVVRGGAGTLFPTCLPSAAYGWGTRTVVGGPPATKKVLDWPPAYEISLIVLSKRSFKCPSLFLPFIACRKKTSISR